MLIRIRNAKPVAAAMRCFAAAAICVAVLAAGGWAAAQQAVPEASASHSGREPIKHGQRHQPSRDETQQRLREAGVGHDPSVSRAELRDLNELSRQLLPPGSPFPAPGVANETARDR